MSRSSGIRRRAPVIIGIFVAVIAAAAIILIALLAVSRMTSPASVSIPTVAMLPSPTTEAATIIPTVTISPPTAAQPAGRPTLPPTWTVTDTPIPSLTPTIAPTGTILPSEEAEITPFPTLSPALLANTYWEGDGTLSMWDLQFPDGSFPRFTVFPVNFWVGTFGDITMYGMHEEAIQNAIEQINQVVPIQRVQNRAFAHITLWLMSDTEFDEHASCDDIDLTVGCTAPTYTDVGIMLVVVWLRVNDDCFAETLLHELTHALGIGVHSPYPEDIMYFQQTCGEPRYSARDLATLRALYSAPAYNPHGS